MGEGRARFVVFAVAKGTTTHQPIRTTSSAQEAEDAVRFECDDTQQSSDYKALWIGYADRFQFGYVDHVLSQTFMYDTRNDVFKCVT